MAVFIQDALRLGGRRIIIWTLLLVLACIHDACAALTVKPEDLQIASSGKFKVADGIYIAASSAQTLGCRANASTVDNATQYKFMSNGGTGRDYVTDNNIYNIIKPDEDGNLGDYTCIAKNGELEADSPSASLTLTLNCSGGVSVCTNRSANSECDGTKTIAYCKCKSYGGVFPTCNECTEPTDCGDHSTCSGAPKVCGCIYAGKPKTCDACNSSSCGDNGKCDGTTPKCTCKYGGTYSSGLCNACNETHGCTAGSKTPRCEKSSQAATPAKCAKCNAEFCKNIEGKTVCDTKEGNCKAKGKTSDAATVTSTVSVFIASVAVALLN